MFRVRLIAKKVEHDRLRDPQIEGQTKQLPVIGSSFMLTAAPRDGGDIRVVNTNVVRSVQRNDDRVLFSTHSGSEYELLILDGGAHESKS